MDIMRAGMQISPKSQMRLLNRETKVNGYLKIDRALEVLQKASDNYKKRKHHAWDVETENLLRESQIFECKLILKEIECL